MATSDLNIGKGEKRVGKLSQGQTLEALLHESWSIKYFFLWKTIHKAIEQQQQKKKK